jgi:hypothetical protein
MPETATRPLTADGKPLVAGMALYMPLGGLETALPWFGRYVYGSQIVLLESFSFEGEACHFLGRPGARCGTDVRKFYADPLVAVRETAERHRAAAARLLEEAARLEAVDRVDFVDAR